MLEPDACFLCNVIKKTRGQVAPICRTCRRQADRGTRRGHRPVVFAGKFPNPIPGFEHVLRSQLRREPLALGMFTSHTQQKDAVIRDGFGQHFRRKRVRRH